MHRKQIFLRLNIDKFGINEDTEKDKLNFESWLDKKRSEEKLKRRKEEQELDWERHQCLENIKRKTLAKLKYDEWLAQKETKNTKKLEGKQQEIEEQICQMRRIFSHIKYEEWLAKKAKQVCGEKLNCERALHSEQEQERRRLLAQAKYQEWLQKKQREFAVKKINEIFLQIREEKAHKIRKQESELAYYLWLRNSKSKPKQVVSRRNSETQKPTASVRFINPNPWKSNIEGN